METDDYVYSEEEEYVYVNKSGYLVIIDYQDRMWELKIGDYNGKRKEKDELTGVGYFKIGD
jgi:hypothetical protein